MLSVPKVWPPHPPHPPCCSHPRVTHKSLRQQSVHICWEKKEQSHHWYLLPPQQRVFFWWVQRTASWSGMWDLLAKRKAAAVVKGWHTFKPQTLKQLTITHNHMSRQDVASEPIVTKHLICFCLFPSGSLTNFNSWSETGGVEEFNHRLIYNRSWKSCWLEIFLGQTY